MKIWKNYVSLLLTVCLLFGSVGIAAPQRIPLRAQVNTLPFYIRMMRMPVQLNLHLLWVLPK